MLEGGSKVLRKVGQFSVRKNNFAKKRFLINRQQLVGIDEKINFLIRSKDIRNSFVVAGDIKIGFDNKDLLWLFLASILIRYKTIIIETISKVINHYCV